MCLSGNCTAQGPCLANRRRRRERDAIVTVGALVRNRFRGPAGSGRASRRVTSAENGSGARRPVDVAPAPETASPGGPELGTPATRDEGRRGPAQPYSSPRASALRWLPWLA